METESDEQRPQPYGVPRGTCPDCGSSEVRHLMIGMPAHPDVLQLAPDWVVSVGCVHPGYDRRCTDCGATWS